MAIGGAYRLAVLLASILIGLTASMPAATVGADAIVCDWSNRFPHFPSPDRLKRLARGFNLPNWDAAEPERRPDTATLSALRQRGFSHIRLPVFHDGFSHGDLAGAAVSAYVEQLTATISDLNRRGFLVSVDLHPDAAMNALYRADPELGLARLEAIWRALAARLSGFGADSIVLEALNEPDTDAATWERHGAALVRLLRRLFPHHTIILGPSGAQRFEDLQNVPEIRDQNIVYAVHFYDPFLFTHQGADWLSDNDPIRYFRHLPFPMAFEDEAVQLLYKMLLAEGRLHAAETLRMELKKPWGIGDIDEAFERMRDWSVANARPLIINEFGVLADHAPRIARLTWLKTIAGKAGKNCFAWTHWDYSDGFGFVDAATQTADEAILKMLLQNVE